MKPRVLLDTNIIISGLVFSGGNEHKILRLAEEGDIFLVLPQFVVQETERVLAKKFGSYQVLLKVFLSGTQHSVVPWQEFEHLLPQCQGMIRDQKDVPVLACILACNPHFVVTGDKALREDLSECQETSETKIGSSMQFLRWFKNLGDFQVGENPL